MDKGGVGLTHNRRSTQLKTRFNQLALREKGSVEFHKHLGHQSFEAPNSAMFD